MSNKPYALTCGNMPESMEIVHKTDTLKVTTRYTDFKSQYDLHRYIFLHAEQGFIWSHAVAGDQNVQFQNGRHFEVEVKFSPPPLRKQFK